MCLQRRLFSFIFLLCSCLLPAQFINSRLGASAAATCQLNQHAGTCAGPAGKRYTCRADGSSILFSVLADDGKTVLVGEKAIAPFKSGGPDGQPSIACDSGSSSSYKGRIYVCWSDERNGAGNKDVFLVYSDDGGGSWTEPVLVTYRPNHKSQFGPAMVIDEESGRLYLCYFDGQNYVDGAAADLYLAISDNGGLLFSYYKISQHPVPLAETIQLRTGMKAVAPGEVGICWSVGPANKKPAVFMAWTNEILLNACNQLAGAESGKWKAAKSFTFDDSTKVSFFTYKTIRLDVAITRPLEPGFEKVVFRNKKFRPGDHRFMLDTKALGLPKGNYVITFYHNGGNSYSWLMEE